MSDIKIKYVDSQGSGVAFSVSDPAIVERLKKLDRTNDPEISEADFADVPFASRDSVFLDSVAKALFPDDGNKRAGFRRLIPLHNRADRFAKTLDQWDQIHIDWGKGTRLTRDLEFSAQDWPTVESQISGNGEMSRENIANLGYEMYAVPRLLADLTDFKSPLPIESHGGCGENAIYGYEYDENAIPYFLRDLVATTIHNYLRGAEWFRDYDVGFRIQCDEWGVGSLDRCPPNSDFSFSFVRYLKEITSSGQFKNLSRRLSCGGGM